ncbi:hypothetical protein [Vogesella indigofera]|uniref:hypothetical protein n=1 Tax=Vogesella indigofera TaxID=45465 RepID=UPI003F424D8E
MTHSRCLFALLCAVTSLAAHAEDSATFDGSGLGNSGVLSVNQAAGQLNQQANLRAFSQGESGDTLTFGHMAQFQIDSNSTGMPQGVNATAAIIGNSFAGNTGVIGINQTAGIANSSANVMSLTVGPARALHGQSMVLASDRLLADTVADTSAQAAQPAAAANVLIGDQAFQGATGVVQLNQVAGALNQTSNALAIRIALP